MPVVPIAGNQFTLAVGRQSAKGTAASTANFKRKVTGGDIAPAVTTFPLTETDSTPQAGAQVKAGATIAGSPSFYARPDDVLLDLFGILGSISTSGAGPNYTHTLTPATAPGYFTWWKNQGAAALIDQYYDVVYASVALAGGQGQALTVTPTLIGLNAVANTTDSGLAVVTSTPYTYPEVVVTKAGSAPGTIESFDIMLTRNAAAVGGDSGVFPPAVAWHRFDITGTINILFQNDDDYNSFNYGSSGATSMSTTVVKEALVITLTRDANTSVALTLTGVSYTAYPVPPNTDGSPLRVAAAFRAEPQTTLANYITATVKNQTAALTAS